MAKMNNLPRNYIAQPSIFEGFWPRVQRRDQRRGETKKEREKPREERREGNRGAKTKQRSEQAREIGRVCHLVAGPRLMPARPSEVCSQLLQRKIPGVQWHFARCAFLLSSFSLHSEQQRCPLEHCMDIRR